MSTEHVALVGFMGSGKSTLGPRLATRLGQEFVDLDVAIEESAGKSIASIFDEDGELEFRRLESSVLSDFLARSHPHVIATGGGIVENPSNRDLLHEGSLVIWLDARFETLRRRLTAEEPGRRPLIARLGWEGLRRLHQSRRPLYADGAHFRFDTDRELPARLVQRIAVDLAERQGSGPG